MIKRIFLYFKEMYPILPRFLYSIGCFLSFYLLYSHLGYGKKNVIIEIDNYFITGVLTFFFLLLFLRLSDEIKDYKTDLKLFPKRLIPSGKVKIKDVWFLWGFSLALLLGINIPVSTIFFWILITFSLLMFKYFFFARFISKSLILALITHNPVGILMNLYAGALISRKEAIAFSGRQAIFTSILLWLPFLIWELSRKIRAPEDETDYETYSKIFGYKRAVLIPLFLFTIFTTMLFLTKLLSIPALIIISLFQIYFTFITLRFFFKPSTKNAKLKGPVEILFIAEYLVLCIDLGIKSSFAWGGF